MSKYLEEFKQALNSKGNRLKETKQAIADKTTELEESKKLYAKAILADATEKANNLYTKIKMLELDIEKLNNTKQILENLKGGEDKDITEIAEKLKQAHIEEMKKQASLKREYFANIAVIEQEYRNRLLENGKNINKCVSNAMKLASEIIEVLDYLDSVDENTKRIVKKNGETSVFNSFRIGL